MAQQDRPKMAPFGIPITASGVQEVWDAFVKPEQDEDYPQSAEMRMLMGILRWASTTLEALEEQDAADAEEAETGERPDSGHAATMHVHIKPAVDEDEWEAAVETVTARWDRRLDLVERAIKMMPLSGHRGGLAEAFLGEGREPQPMEKALKIARFAADGHRDIPGVDL